MKLYANQLTAHLSKGLSHIYLVYGDEPFLVDQCRRAILDKSRETGFSERTSLVVEGGFDWAALRADTQSMSLFSEKRLIDLRLPTGKPGEAGSKVLAEMAATAIEDTVVLISAGKLESSARSSKWVKSIEQHGVALAVYPLEAAAFRQWLQAQLAAHKLRPEAGVIEFMAYHFEGNMLAAAQEIEKLGIMTSGSAQLSDVEAALQDNARFDVFQLVDCCVGGDATTALRMLRSLGAEGVAPALVLWALVREIRTLVQLAEVRATGGSESSAYAQLKVWPKRQPLLGRALQRLSLPVLLALLQQGAWADRVVKGRAVGEPWLALEYLALGLARGIQPFAITL